MDEISASVSLAIQDFAGHKINGQHRLLLFVSVSNKLYNTMCESMQLLSSTVGKPIGN